MSDTDATFNFMISLIYTQLFNLLCDKADDEHGGRLPYHVRLLLDEFANIGQIPKFDKLIATIRSREISASIILQSQSQLKSIYKDAAETLIGAAEMVKSQGISPKELAQKVCSPGGTTIEGVKSLWESDLDGVVEKALQAAYDRSVELAKN